MQTHGKYVFVGFNHLTPDAPFFHKAPTYEIEHPWRVCPESRIIKLPGNRGVVIGRWRKNNREWHESVMEIIQGREIADEETTAQ